MAYSAPSKLELVKLIDTTADKYDLCSGMPHLHLAFIFRTIIQGHPDNFTPQERWEMLHNKFMEAGQISNREALLVSGSAAEGLFIPLTLINNGDGTYVQKAADVDVMLVNETLHVINKPVIVSKPCIIFDPACCHHGYTRIRVVGDLPNQSVQVEQLNYVAYVSNQKMFSEINEKILGSYTTLHKEITQECGIVGGSITRRQGPALTDEGAFFMCENLLEVQLDMDTVPGLKTDWPNEARAWKLRRRHSNWPATEVIDILIADGCHVVPVAHASSHFPSIEWRLSFSKAEIMLAHSLTPFQRSCYRVFKLICSTGITPKKVIATYFLKTTFFWLCEEMPESFWQMHNASFILIALVDKLLCFLSKRVLPNFFVPENNMVDHILPEKLKKTLQSITKIRANPLKYLMMFSTKSVFEDGGIQWHVAFKPAIKDISMFMNHNCLLVTMGAFNQSLRRCAGLQISGCSYKEALDSFNSSADITELCQQYHLPHRLAFAAYHSINLPAQLPPETLFSTLHRLTAFHQYLLSLVCVDEEKGAILYNLGYIYLVLSQLPAPIWSKSFQPALDTLQKLQSEFYEERFLNHRVQHLTQARQLFDTARSLMEAASRVKNPTDKAQHLPSQTAISCRLAQVYLLQGNPTEAAACLQEVIRDPDHSQSELTFFWYEKGLHDIDFIMTSILGVHNVDTAQKMTADMNNLPFNERSSFPKRLQDDVFTELQCNMFVRYLLILVELLEEQSSKTPGQHLDVKWQKSAEIELIQLNLLCQLESKGLGGKSMALYDDCCLIMKMLHHLED